jgi:PAS domain S-box-containing protein
MLVAPERLPFLAQFIERVLRDGAMCQYESVLVRKDGRKITVSATATRIKNCKSAIESFSVILQDITDRKRVADALCESEERFRNMADSCPSMMWVTDAKGSVQFINSASRQFLGATCEQLAADAWRPAVHPDDLAGPIAFHQAVDERRPFREDFRVRRADGEWRLIGFNAVPRLSPSGEYMGHIGLSADITDRNRSEATLRESEERFRIMADSSPIGIWVTDAEGGTRFINKKYREFCGQASEEVDKNEWRSLIHPDDAPGLFEALECSLKEHTPFHVERRSRRADGNWRWIESDALARFSPDGEFLGLVGTSKDITERKQTEEALQQSEEKFRQLTENIREIF